MTETASLPLFFSTFFFGMGKSVWSTLESVFVPAALQTKYANPVQIEYEKKARGIFFPLSSENLIIIAVSVVWSNFWSSQIVPSIGATATLQFSDNVKAKDSSLRWRRLYSWKGFERMQVELLLWIKWCCHESYANTGQEKLPWKWQWNIWDAH